jgi:NAD-reducing hydrogenase small subunit
MSFLDLDERLIELAEHVELVYSPLVDAKEYPAAVDVCLVEGAVSSEEDLHKIKLVRERTRTLVAFGDCAVTTNVPGMRNTFGTKAILDRAYVENASLNRRAPSEEVPRLLPVAVPVHHVVSVDCFLPGCPPSADLIWQILTDLLGGKTPDPARLARFGK